MSSKYPTAGIDVLMRIRTFERTEKYEK